MSPELVPEWEGPMPPPASPRLPATSREGAAAVYFPACINRIFGPPGLAEAMVAVSARAGMPVWIPDDVAGRCCATPWTSKGYRARRRVRGEQDGRGAVAMERGGRAPVVVDASSCTHGLTDAVAERHPELELSTRSPGPRRLLPRLSIKRRLGSIAIHPTCSARHLGLARPLQAVAAELADEVVVPPTATCCGFAGDRGFLHPELTASATAPAARELAGRALRRLPVEQPHLRARARARDR